MIVPKLNKRIVVCQIVFNPSTTSTDCLFQSKENENVNLSISQRFITVCLESHPTH